MNIPSLKPTIHRALDCLARTTQQASIPRSPEPTPYMHVFTSDLAIAEGWDLFDCGLREDGTPHIEIQRLDSVAPGKPRFDADHAAWDHVASRAQAGSALHLRALTMVDPTERKLIGWWCPAAALLP